MFSKNSYGLEAMVKDRLHQKNSESPSLLPCFMQCEKLIENITDENEEQEYEEKEEKHSINNLNTNEYRTLALKHKFDIRRAVRTFKDDSFDNLSNLDKFLLCMLLNFFEEKHLKKHNLNVCDPEIADAENDENVNKLVSGRKINYL